MMSTLSKKLKAWPVWMLMGILVVALLAVGAGRQSGPLTQEDRIDNVTQRLACPTCDGESVYVSQAPSSQNIRNEVARQVASGQRTDDEIVAFIESSFGGQVLLVPRATGLDALIWVLPIAVLVCCTAGLALTFRRWKREQGGQASDADRALVAQLLELDSDPTDSL
ncbi:MAG: cytochrome c-type biogenesis protein CcmH [Actinobacteria bacterium]|nr:cytochrome c-type biogenesis protein CcmH [Actinomycetota bacterium]